MDIEKLEYGIMKYGTPLYVYDIDEMRKNNSYFRANLNKKIDICYAMKANPFLVKEMERITERIEVCSMGEYEICRRNKIDPEKILISGVLKKKEEFYKILDNYGGKSSYTIESLDQFQNLINWCDLHNETIKVYLRLTSGNQFGMDEEAIEHIISMSNMFPYMKIKGIHYFSGTQKKIEKIKTELQYLDEFLLRLEEKTGVAIEELEYGPGFSVSYFDGQKDTSKENITSINECALEMRWNGKITIEMGRALAATCGYYLTSVRDIKKNNRKNYCIVDGGIHQVHYDGQIRGMYRPKIRTIAGENKEKKAEYTVCGSLCTANDVLIQKIKLSKLQIGNVLVFENTGAYAVTEGMALFLNHELPTVVFYSEESGWKLVRKEQQTFEWNMERIVENERIDGHFKRN